MQNGCLTIRFNPMLQFISDCNSFWLFLVPGTFDWDSSCKSDIQVAHQGFAPPPSQLGNDDSADSSRGLSAMAAIIASACLPSVSLWSPTLLEINSGKMISGGFNIIDYIHDAF